jgi:hypothetical protein
MGLVLLIVLVLLFFGSAPAYPYSRGWGYAPMSFTGLLLAILLVLLVMQIIPFGPLPWSRPVVVGP